MRHISIKVRMTIWFTVVMVVISSLMLVFVMLMNRNQVTKPPAAQVVSVVTRNADRLEVEHASWTSAMWTCSATGCIPRCSTRRASCWQAPPLRS